MDSIVKFSWSQSNRKVTVKIRKLDKTNECSVEMHENMLQVVGLNYRLVFELYRKINLYSSYHKEYPQYLIVTLIKRKLFIRWPMLTVREAQIINLTTNRSFVVIESKNLKIDQGPKPIKQEVVSVFNIIKHQTTFSE